MNAATGQLAADPIARLMPGCTDPEERDLRSRLAQARETAAWNVDRLPDSHTLRLNIMIEEIARGFVFAPEPVVRLRLALEQCRRLMRAAGGAEELEGGH